jgi:hypothetical protein
MCFEPRLRWLAQAARLPAIIARDLLTLAKVLGRHLVRKPSQSVFELVRFRVTGNDCRASAKRALAVLFVSTSPTTVALDIDREKSRMLIHRLGEAPVQMLVGKAEE